MYDQIRSLCAENHISVLQLAKIINVSKNTIGRWDTNSPSIDKVLAVADHFDVSVDYLCGRTKEKKLADKISELPADEQEIIYLWRDASEEKKALVKSLIYAALNPLAASAPESESSE